MYGSVLCLSKTVSKTPLTRLTQHCGRTTQTNVLSYHLNWAQNKSGCLISDDKLFNNRGVTTPMFCSQKNFVCNRRPVFECQQNAIVRHQHHYSIFTLQFLLTQSLSTYHRLVSNTSSTHGNDPSSATLVRTLMYYKSGLKSIILYNQQSSRLSSSVTYSTQHHIIAVIRPAYLCHRATALQNTALTML